MKTLLFIVTCSMRTCIILAILISCGEIPFDPLDKESLIIKTNISKNHKLEKIDESIDIIATKDKGQPKNFEIKLAGMSLSATVDEIGNVTILNYPTEWHGKATMIRFDGSSEFPLDNSCEILRKMAHNGYSAGLIRSGYPSILTFEVPAFLSYEFMVALRESAQTAGITLQALQLKNAANSIDSTIDFSLSENAISRITGNIPLLLEQFHLGRKGNENKKMQKEIQVFSGDAICDLISGDAKIIMTYPIKGEDKVIKVIYDTMKIKLK